MKVGERMIEAAEASVALERDAAITRIRTSLGAAGATHCARCGDVIGEERRTALPSAVRCVGCQERFERKKRLRSG